MLSGGFAALASAALEVHGSSVRGGGRSDLSLHRSFISASIQGAGRGPRRQVHRPFGPGDLANGLPLIGAIRAPAWIAPALYLRPPAREGPSDGRGYRCRGAGSDRREWDSLQERGQGNRDSSSQCCIDAWGDPPAPGVGAQSPGLSSWVDNYDESWLGARSSPAGTVDWSLAKSRAVAHGSYSRCATVRSSPAEPWG